MLKRLTLALSLCLMLVSAFGVSLASAETNTNDLFFFFGEVEARDADSVTISGFEMGIDENTFESGTVDVGDTAITVGTTDPMNGAITLDWLIELGNTDPFVNAAGEITALTESSVTVDGQTFTLVDSTIINGDLAVGGYADVTGLLDNAAGLIAFMVSALDEAPPEYVQVQGMVTAVSDTELVVEDKFNGTGEVFTFTVSAETYFSAPVEVGSMVAVEGTVVDGTLTANYVLVIDDTTPPPTAEFYGTLTAFDDTSLTVETDSETVTIAVDDNTQVFGALTVGEPVFVIAEIEDDGSFTALWVETSFNYPGNDYKQVVGDVLEITDDSIMVAGESLNPLGMTEIVTETFVINSNTVYWTLPEVGDKVFVDAIFENDVWVAYWIDVIDDDGNEAVFEFIGEITAVGDNTFTINDTDITTNDATSFEDGYTPEVGDAVYVLGFVDSATGTYIAIYVTEYDDADLSYYFDIQGNIDAISGTTVTVDGTNVTITDNTYISDDIEVGTEVYVSGLVVDGEKIADSILVLDGNGNLPIAPLVEALGTITAYDETSITVDGITFNIGDQTETFGTPEVDLWAYVVGLTADDGVTIDALVIVVLDETSVNGVIDSISPEGVTVGGTTYRITSETRMVGELRVGTSVHIGLGAADARNAGGEALLIQATTAAPTAVALSSSGTSISSVGLLAVAMLTLATVTGRAWIKC